MAKLIRITTVPISLHKLIKGQPNFMKKHDFEVLLASADGEEIPLIKEDTGIDVKVIPYTRKISPITDLKALWLTYKYFKKEKPEIVHTHTPKAGIVGMLAAKLAGVPIRMHTVAGLPLMETRGVKRRVLNTVEKLTSWASYYVYPNSYTLKEFMEKEKLAPKRKLKVIGNGSSNGINTKEFDIQHYNEHYRFEKRRELGISTNDLVFVFVGRLVTDKGINELLWAFDKISNKSLNAKLLLVGSEEKELDPLSEKSQKILNNNKQIISVGWQEDVRPFLAISNVFVFPSYREGFPNVVLQAGAMGLPSIATNINGCNEIIEDGVNGIIIPVKDKETLHRKMKLLLTDIPLRETMANSTRQMIIDRYEQKFVWNALLKEYKKLLEQK